MADASKSGGWETGAIRRLALRGGLVLLITAVAALVLSREASIPIGQLSRADAAVETAAPARARNKPAHELSRTSPSPGTNIGRAPKPGPVDTRVVQLIAEKARLEAERDAVAELRFPRGFAASHHRAAAAAAHERRVFETRRAAIDRQKALLGRRITQGRHEVDGLLLLQRAREKEVHLIREELRLIDDMHARKLANLDRHMNVRRNLARAEGELGGVIAQVARARAQIEEIELQAIEAEQKMVLEAHRELREVQARIDELSPLRGEDRPTRFQSPEPDRQVRKRSEQRSAGNS